MLIQLLKVSTRTAAVPSTESCHDADRDRQEIKYYLCFQDSGLMVTPRLIWPQPINLQVKRKKNYTLAQKN